MTFAALAIQSAIFFIFMLAANYFILQRKKENRLKLSVQMSAVAAVIYGIIIWMLKST